MEVLTRALVEDPDRVEVKEVENGASLMVEVKVAPDDAGRVIGKQGRIARALRTVVKAVAARDGKKATVEIEP